jgi:hypothetical protein
MVCSAWKYAAVRKDGQRLATVAEHKALLWIQGDSANDLR